MKKKDLSHQQDKSHDRKGERKGHFMHAQDAQTEPSRSQDDDASYAQAAEHHGKEDVEVFAKGLLRNGISCKCVHNTDADSHNDCDDWSRSFHVAFYVVRYWCSGGRFESCPIVRKN